MTLFVTPARFLIFVFVFLGGVRFESLELDLPLSLHQALVSKKTNAVLQKFKTILIFFFKSNQVLLFKDFFSYLPFLFSRACGMRMEMEPYLVTFTHTAELIYSSVGDHVWHCKCGPIVNSLLQAD